ncbi:MAG: DUF1571 domain-containing protein [Planctomycetia bacterium]|nr:DUF1571 domain-containing protein [Planctomycetia bacterium]
MAFHVVGAARLAICLSASLAASTATAQIYRQAPPTAPRYPSPPPVYGTAPATARQRPQGSAPLAPYTSAPGYAAATAAPPAAYAPRTQPPGAIRPVQFEQPIESAPSVPSASVAAQQPAPPASDPPAFRATEVSTSSLPSTIPAAAAAGAPGAAEHPLMPALRWAKQGFDDLNKIQDYSCTLVKRERIDGTLGEHEYMFVKVRHHPFSVYTYFLGPARVKGQEAIYVDGQNSGSLLAHANGLRHRLIGTVALKPTSMLAMSGNKYPITEMGMRRLLERLIEIGSEDVKYGECTVNWIQGAKVNGRTCTRLEVVHPVPRRNFLFHLARIYVDDEMQLPIRYEAYEWPARAGEQPPLTEEYTFLNVKLNNGFTDQDFSAENPSYGFK